MNNIKLVALPRQEMSWEDFVSSTPRNSIALDGIVGGGPKFDPATNHINFDHHSGVVREATMSTSKQTYFAVKGGLFESFRNSAGLPEANVYINDSDQDTALAVFILDNYKMFEGTNSIPTFNRLLDLTDKLDITGGAFPLNLNEILVRQHNWIFDAYSVLRKSGALSTATPQQLIDNIESTISRIHRFLMGNADMKPLDIRHEIIKEHPKFKVVNEIGGNEARYHLYSQGMNAFVSLITVRPDGRRVYSIGKRSSYIPFPVKELYAILNEAEGLSGLDKWGGSDIIGGSARIAGSKLSPLEIAELIESYLNR